MIPGGGIDLREGRVGRERANRPLMPKTPVTKGAVARTMGHCRHCMGEWNEWITLKQGIYYLPLRQGSSVLVLYIESHVAYDNVCTGDKFKLICSISQPQLKMDFFATGKDTVRKG